MNEDGSMARVPELLKYCEKHNLKIASIAPAAISRADNDQKGDGEVSENSKSR